MHIFLLVLCILNDVNRVLKFCVLIALACIDFEDIYCFLFMSNSSSPCVINYTPAFFQ